LFKDSILDELAKTNNVAQFVSFDPEGNQRYLRLKTGEFACLTARQAIHTLLRNSSSDMVNIRSFKPESPKGSEFRYGLDSIDEILMILEDFGKQSLYTIVNETIDIRDGGVSGVMLGNTIEFSPEDTPRCVEKPGTVSLPLGLGLAMLRRVYGFSPTVSTDFVKGWRTEFSIHPNKCGLRDEQTIIWEIEYVGETDSVPNINWPNNFSRFIGDKAYGLLMADLLGFRVPLTTIISRKIAPFTLGVRVGVGYENWIRTAPSTQSPGKFTTSDKWQDPFKLMSEEDPDHTEIASILAQQAVTPVYSGAAVSSSVHGVSIIEGVAGKGDKFMVGEEGRQLLPSEVDTAVCDTYHSLLEHFDSPSFEWVYDGRKVWIVQLHADHSVVSDTVIVSTNKQIFYWHDYDVSLGLYGLINLITRTSVYEGIRLIGDVGITSHFGDLLRQAKIPSYITRKGES